MKSPRGMTRKIVERNIEVDVSRNEGEVGRWLQKQRQQVVFQKSCGILEGRGNTDLELAKMSKSSPWSVVLGYTIDQIRIWTGSIRFQIISIIPLRVWNYIVLGPRFQHSLDIPAVYIIWLSSKLYCFKTVARIYLKSWILIKILKVHTVQLVNMLKKLDPLTCSFP